MRKSTLAALLATPTLLLPTIANAGLLDGDAVRDATQAIEHTVGAGNISATKLSGDPLGAIKQAGTSILSTKKLGKKTITAQSYVAANGSEVSFAIGLSEKSQLSVAQIKCDARDNYDECTITNISGGPEAILATLEVMNLADSFKFYHDITNMARIETQLHAAGQQTLEQRPLVYTDYSETDPTTVHVRACYPAELGTACNEIATTIYTNYADQSIGLKVEAIAIDPATKPGEDRKKTVVTTYMSNIRDNETFDGPYSTPYESDADTITKGALALETRAALADFLLAHTNTVPCDNRVSVIMGGIKFSTYAPLGLSSDKIEIKTSDPNRGSLPVTRPSADAPTPGR